MVTKRKKQKAPDKVCWKCAGEVFIPFKHKRTGYRIYACKNCYAPYDLSDERGLKLMEAVGKHNEAAAIYARTWREYIGTVRET